VVTAQSEADVPKDFKKEPGVDFPKIPISPGTSWIFYADKVKSSGSLGVIFPPEEGASGEVRMSNYGQAANLDYPPDTRRIHLGFYAFGLENEASKRLFLDSLEKELARLRSVPFYEEGK
jgi:hypothetical protein